MKKIVIGLFASQEDAEKTIQQVHEEVGVDTSEISYVYRTADDTQKEIDVDDITENTPREGAEDGALVGGSIGALLGLAAVAGVIPIIGPIFAAGPLVTALGITGALGTTVAGAATGAAAGGIIGALATWGAPEDEARSYEERVLAGNILVAVHTDKDNEVRVIMERNDAFNLNIYELSV